MATPAEKDEPTQQTRVEQVTIVSGQVIHARGTLVLALCLVGALLTLAPLPWSALAVALLVYITSELSAKVVRR